LYVLNQRVPGTLTEIELSLEADLQESIHPPSDIELGSRVGLGMPGLAIDAELVA
jgi:hypothetical protein